MTENHIYIMFVFLGIVIATVFFIGGMVLAAYLQKDKDNEA